MSKKDEIIDLLKQGSTVNDIVERGYNKKYIGEIIRDIKKDEIYMRQNEFNNSNDDKGQNIIESTINNKQTLEEEENRDLNNKNIKICNIDDFERLENFIASIKENFEYIHDIEIKVNVTWRFKQCNDNEKVKEPTFNPIEVFRQEGQERLEILLRNIGIDEMKTIIRKYFPDPRGYAYKWEDRVKIMEYIIQRTSKLADKGNVFFTE